MMTPAPHRHPLLSHRASDEEVIALTVPYRSKATPVSKQNSQRMMTGSKTVLIMYLYHMHFLGKRSGNIITCYVTCTHHYSQYANIQGLIKSIFLLNIHN